MRSIEGKPYLRPPEHLSHSSRETLLRCAKSYFLSRMTPAPKQPALWLATGSAVHEVTEAWDRASVANELEFWRDVQSVWDVAFNAQLEELRAKDANEYHWKRSKSEPIEWWNARGPQMIQGYIDWRRRAPYEIWTTPDGEAAVELDVSGHLPGCEVEVKGYIDRVFHDPVLDQLIVVDIKTSKSPPKGADQFATYAALLAAKYDVAVPLGAAYMTRTGTLATPWPLLAYTPEVMGELFQEAWEQIKKGDFTATPGRDSCFLCDVSSSCAAVNGPLARLYDPASLDYEHPPF